MNEKCWNDISGKKFSKKLWRCNTFPIKLIVDAESQKLLVRLTNFKLNNFEWEKFKGSEPQIDGVKPSFPIKLIQLSPLLIFDWMKDIRVVKMIRASLKRLARWNFSVSSIIYYTLAMENKTRINELSYQLSIFSTHMTDRSTPITLV